MVTYWSKNCPEENSLEIRLLPCGMQVVVARATFYFSAINRWEHCRQVLLMLMSGESILVDFVDSVEQIFVYVLYFEKFFTYFHRQH